MESVKTNNSRLLSKVGRIIKFLRFGRGQEATEISPFGIDSSPLDNMIAIYAETSKKGAPVIIGYINRDQKAGKGEIRLFSKNADGEEQTYLWLKSGGVIEIGGSDDFMMSFNKTKEAFEELQNSVSDLKSIISSWVPVPNDGGAALKSALTTWYGTAFTKDIDNAKLPNVKTAQP